MRNSIVSEDLETIANSKIPYDKFKNKTVLISGASGMIGGYLCESLLYLNEKRKLNIRVIALARNKNKSRLRFFHYLGRKDLKIIIGDVNNPIKNVKNIDYIIHAASPASPKYFATDPIGTLLPNIIGTKNLLELAAYARSDGFLFISSGEVYGQVSKVQIPTGEDDYGPLNPLNLTSSYGESKRMGEAMCMAWLHAFGVKVKIVRPFHVYGPGMDLEDGRVFADFVKNIINSNNIVVKSRGGVVRTFCYLTDATTAFFKVLLEGKVGEPYNVGNDREEVNIKGLARRLVAAFPERKLKVVVKPKESKYLRSDIIRSCPDISKIKSLGWNPSISIENGFRRTVNSFS